MQRELSSLPLPPLQRMRLQSAGFVTVEDLDGVRPSELSKELSITLEEALELLQVAIGGRSSVTSTEEENVDSAVSPSSSSVINKVTIEDGQTARVLDLLQEASVQHSIITFSEQLDRILGGGVPLRKITEFCGAPGIGKTQFSMQLAVDVQIPESFGGLGGQAFYIDTEGSLVVHRLRDIGGAAIAHCQQVAKLDRNADQLEILKSFTINSILHGVHYFRCHDYVELVALIHLLPDLLQEHPLVKLIVVDSIAFPFRHDFEDFSLRTRLLNGIAQSLIKISTLNNLAVVLTNQMTTKVGSGGSSGQLVPALGESWGHVATIRIILYWHQQRRCALLYKSPLRQEASITYQITGGGVRDVAMDMRAGDMEPCEDTGEQARKRSRIE